MATLRELIIKISANSQSFQTEISRASRMGQDYYRTMQNGGRQAAAAARESERALSDLTAGFASAGRAAAAATAAFATGKIVQIADEWNSVNARLKQASSSADDFATSQRQLMEISQRTGTAFSDNANLFSRAAASMREYGYSSDEVLKITEAVSTGLKLSGANTQEASSVITQFSQALAQGVLRGEEFNAVNEAGDRVIRALAAGMGVARKDLKSMADQGQLTIDKVVPALMSQLGALQGEFASMPQTVSGSLQKVTNSFMAWVGGVNQATGATDALSGGLDNVAQTLDSFTSSAVSGALSDVADNMSTITTVAGALVGVGLARYADCWSLIMDYFRIEHGIELPNYSIDRHWWEQGENLYMDNWQECGFREYDGPAQPGDMVIMQVQSTVPNHAGILLDGNMLLHHMYGQLSQRIPYGGYYRDRTIKILRYKDLM